MGLSTLRRVSIWVEGDPLEIFSPLGNPEFSLHFWLVIPLDNNTGFVKQNDYIIMLVYSRTVVLLMFYHKFMTVPLMKSLQVKNVLCTHILWRKKHDTYLNAN